MIYTREEVEAVINKLNHVVYVEGGIESIDGELKILLALAKDWIKLGKKMQKDYDKFKGDKQCPTQGKRLRKELNK